MNQSSEPKPKIRNDGKPARRPLLGLQKGGPRPAVAVTERERSPMWHELVQPGPKGNPGETFRRREAHGQVTPDTGTTLPLPKPPRQGGAVRLGLYRTLHTAATGRHQSSERVRVVKGSRIGGVEVRYAGTRLDRAADRQRRHAEAVAAGQHATRKSRREAAKSAERAA